MGQTKRSEVSERQQAFREGYENKGGLMGPVVDHRRPPTAPALKPKPKSDQEGAK